MKPSPDRDFSVVARKHEWEVPEDVAPYYHGVFDVRLNYTVGVCFVPAFDRTEWPGKVLDDGNPIQSTQDARAMAAAVARYVVTPDTFRQGTEDRFPREWSESGSGVLFYVSPAEYGTFSRELARLADERPAVNEGWRVSEIPELAVTRFLTERLLASPHMRPRDLHILGR